jgi:hypothetical protein
MGSMVEKLFCKTTSVIVAGAKKKYLVHFAGASA